jgi:uncharacterized protein (DUF1330 family)
MPAYLIGDVEVHDSEAYASYLELGPKSVELHGGRFLSRGAVTEELEGSWPHNRIVLIEFQSLDAARSWYTSPEFAEAKRRRERAASVNYLLVGDSAA